MFGVGDDDQTIYGYNGADPQWLIDFASLFPGAGDHPLEVNYRCPGGVVDAADRLLRHNRRRVAKTIRAASPDRPVAGSSTPATTPWPAPSHAVEAALAGGAAPGDIAVLTRVNALLAPVQVALLAAGVAVSGGVGREFARSHRGACRAGLDAARRPRGGRFARRRRRRGAAPAVAAAAPDVADWVAEQSAVDGLRRLAGRVNNERDAAAGRRVRRRHRDACRHGWPRGATTADIVLHARRRDRPRRIGRDARRASARA